MPTSCIAVPVPVAVEYGTLVCPECQSLMMMTSETPTAPPLAPIGHFGCKSPPPDALRLSRWPLHVRASSPLAGWWECQSWTSPNQIRPDWTERVLNLSKTDKIMKTKIVKWVNFIKRPLANQSTFYDAITVSRPDVAVLKFLFYFTFFNMFSRQLGNQTKPDVGA